MKLTDLLTGDNLGKVIAVLVVLSGGSDIIQTKMTESKIESTEGNLLREMYKIEKRMEGVGNQNGEMLRAICVKLGLPTPTPTPTPTPEQK